ncbi:EF-hand domain-containing C3orf25 [Brachionus plicatilis]|uniref:EF-hand domain-containing C3orf25 n=1 Tax=Brachionus plicatilis TaxID=10195 RepID=A0A3M7TAJ5_BRAPC|nr:EF-hand domain-containing C3orf25 [Brachionus plicatilis]
MALKNIERPESECSYCLDRLFDPEELYYTPMDELLKRYKKRNLIPGRMFNLAKKYGNVPEKRTRVIQAPQMERAGQRIFGTENFYFPPPKVYFCTRPKEPVKEQTSTCSSEDENNENLNYANWMKKRKNLRDGLNKLDLNSNYLKNKKNLTEVEKRVLHSMIYEDKQIQTDPLVL